MHRNTSGLAIVSLQMFLSNTAIKMTALGLPCRENSDIRQAGTDLENESLEAANLSFPGSEISPVPLRYRFCWLELL